MTTKPDYEAAWAVMRAAGCHPTEGLVPAVIDAALGDDLLAFAVDVLIAEGGETQRTSFNPDDIPALAVREHGRYLVYGPIPVEKETTT